MQTGSGGGKSRPSMEVPWSSGLQVPSTPQLFIYVDGLLLLMAQDGYRALLTFCLHFSFSRN